MIQELITFVIVTIAIGFAVWKTAKKFRKKKRKPVDSNLTKEKFTAQLKCSDCSAECIFRNTVISGQKPKGAACEK